MSLNTLIQWCLRTVNPRMGCGGCELFPNPAVVILVIRAVLLEHGVRMDVRAALAALISKHYAILQAHLKMFGRQNGLHRLGTKKSKPRGRGFEDSEGIAGDIGVLTPRARGSEKMPDPRLICSEVTGPALAMLLAQNQQVLLNATAEAGNLLDEAAKATSPLGQLLLKGFSGDPVEIDRVTRGPVVMEEPCISVCWLCQPHRLDKFLASERLLEDGLLPRFLVAHSNASMAPMHGDDGSVPVDVADAYGGLIEELFVLYGRNSNDEWVVQASAEAREVMRIHHNQCVERWNADDGPLRPCIARWSEQAWKIALALHAAIGLNSQPIPGHHRRQKNIAEFWSLTPAKLRD